MFILTYQSNNVFFMTLVLCFFSWISILICFDWSSNINNFLDWLIVIIIIWINMSSVSLHLEIFIIMKLLFSGDQTKKTFFLLFRLQQNKPVASSVMVHRRKSFVKSVASDIIQSVQSKAMVSGKTIKSPRVHNVDSCEFHQTNGDQLRVYRRRSLIKFFLACLLYQTIR